MDGYVGLQAVLFEGCMSFDPARFATEKQIHPLPAVSHLLGVERVIVSKELPSESTLIAELTLLCPELHVRPIREFGRDYKDWTGVWTGGPGNMPDGLQIFNSLIHTTDEGYDGGVHEGFTQWLELRGWYIENYDGQTMFIVPIAYAKELSING